MKKKMSLAVVLGVSLALLIAGIAVALTITIDGVRNPADEWGTNPETCTIGDPGCSRVVDDPQDVVGPVTLYYDIQNVHLTNDPTNFYMSIDFYAQGGTWLRTVTGRPLLRVCFNIDNNNATGSTLGSGWCNGTQQMDGVDVYYEIVAQNSGLPIAPDVYRWNGSSFAYVATGSVGYNSGSIDGFTEVSIPMTSLGYVAGSHLCPISNSPQPCTALMNMFYDNGVAASDDSVPDIGTTTITFGCDTSAGPCSPTAVTLNNLEARPAETNTSAVVILGATLVLAFGALGTLAIRRRKQTTL